MKKKRSDNIFVRGLLMVLASLAIAGCTKESTTNCSITYSLTIRAYAADESDITPFGQVNDVSLYIFDSEGYFIERIETGVGERVQIKVPKGDQITAVAWADASGTGDIFPTLTQGQDHIDDCTVGLVPTRAATLHDSPGDLFHGSLTITRADANTDQVLPVHRKTGLMSVTVRKLREFTQCTDDDFSIVVHETQTHIGFDGTFLGDKIAAYAPAGTFNSSGIYSTGVFSLLPSDEGVTIDVYHGGELLRTVTICAGEPITVTAGLTTNVLIDFSTYADVRVSLTPWGMLEVWKDF